MTEARNEGAFFEMQMSSIPDYASAIMKYTYGSPGYMGFLPEDVAVCPETGNVVVADAYNRKVHVLSPSLEPLIAFGTMGSGPGRFKVPLGVAVNSGGYIYIVDKNNHCIQKTNPDGRVVQVIGGKGARRGEFRFATGIAIDENDLMYICDQFNTRIQVLTPDGGVVNEFTLPRPVSDENVAVPMYNAVKDGVVAVTYEGGDIYVMTSSGQLKCTIRSDATFRANPAPPTASKFGQARGVAFDSHGNLLAADVVGGCVHVIRVLEHAGEPHAVVASGDHRCSGPLGLAITSDGDVVVCDKGNGKIKIFHVTKSTKQS